MNVPRATIDFETRSRINLPKVGPWRYSTDASTQVLCMAYKLPGWAKAKIWIPDIYRQFGIQPTGEPTELFDWIAAGGVVEAHNAMMEKSVWRAIMTPHYCWPDIPRNQWRCSSAKASSYGLPRSLDKACTVMRLPIQKDKEGHKLMMKLCKPRKPTKTDKSEWSGTREEFLRLFAYCLTDVDAEEGFSHSLQDIMPLEQELWMIDQDINEHGLPIDRHFVEYAIECLNRMRLKASDEIKRLTNGRVEKYTARKQLLEWLNDNGLELDNTQAATFDALIEMGDMLPSHVLRVIKLVRQAGRASTSKYVAIMERLTANDRVRDILVYAGASRTSRWSGSGVQFQNLKRSSLEDVEAIIEKIVGSDLEDLEIEYDGEESEDGGEKAMDLFQVFSEVLRGAIVPDPDHDLCWGDYNAIECRGLFWVCDHKEGMKIFHNKEDPYLDMASQVFEVPLASLDKKKNKTERQVGKIGVLGCGYGLGANKMIDYGNKALMAANMEPTIDLEFADKIVSGYRTRHKPVVDFWYACENAAIEAMQNPGKTVWVNDKIAYKRANRFLFCRLPSGRLIPYPYPELHKETRTFKRKKDGSEFTQEKLVLTYEEVNSVTRKWDRTKTYGGKLVENIVQALCRDLMGFAMLTVTNQKKYRVLLTVHDELIAQCKKGTVDTKEFEALMCILPSWAKGFPVTAEAESGARYGK